MLRLAPSTALLFILAGCGGATPEPSTVAAGATSSPAVVGAGTCESPFLAAIGPAIQGDTRTSASNSLAGTCAGDQGSEQVYQVHVSSAVQLTAQLQSTFDGAIYLQSSCGDITSELACNDDAEDITHSFLTALVEPGDYYIVVDAFEDGAGLYELVVTTQAAQPIAQLCSEAPALVPGQAITGTTSGHAGAFSAQCGGNAPGPDAVHVLDITEPSRVRINQQYEEYDGVLYIRSDCNDPDSELLCNDDAEDQSHSRIANTLQAGRYFVYTDGFTAASAGEYTLTAEVLPIAGAGGAGDSCANPTAIAIHEEPSPIDTFPLRDDYAGSCGGQDGADAVLSFSVTARSIVHIAALDVQNPDAVLYVRRQCADAASEMACLRVGSIARGARAQSIHTLLAPGAYFLFVDGFNANAFGSLKIALATTDAAPVEAICRQAQLLRAGQTVSGTTADSGDHFQSSCVPGGNDRAYRFQLRERKQVRFAFAPGFGGSLALRRECATGADIICTNGETVGPDAELTLERGTYYVIVESYSNNDAAPFSLTVTTGPPGTRLAPRNDIEDAGGDDDRDHNVETH
ncbi:MAG: hypothetical protein IPK60_04255 [Sandaracinaceae bacterium]|nr:hypothetical protein [Sandaracinaceae bacterium]